VQSSNLGSPPDDLREFPSAPPAKQWNRVTRHRNPWYFSSQPDDRPGGRFDLDHPHGTCYWAESLEGALLEAVLRVPRRAVTVDRLEELIHHSVKPGKGLRVADATSKLATSFAVNAEIHTTLDYERCREWARALYRDKWRGVRFALRSDSSLRSRANAVFGPKGPSKRAPRALAGAVNAPLDVVVATVLLSRRGVEVLTIPTSVPFAARPDPRIRPPRRRRPDQ
jgi:hypothetical protein